MSSTHQTPQTQQPSLHGLSVQSMDYPHKAGNDDLILRSLFYAHRVGDENFAKVFFLKLLKVNDKMENAKMKIPEQTIKDRDGDF